jgi:hypothetical protein
VGTGQEGWRVLAVVGETYVVGSDTVVTAGVEVYRLARGCIATIPGMAVKR